MLRKWLKLPPPGEVAISKVTVNFIRPEAGGILIYLHSDSANAQFASVT